MALKCSQLPPPLPRTDARIVISVENWVYRTVWLYPLYEKYSLYSYSTLHSGTQARNYGRIQG